MKIQVFLGFLVDLWSPVEPLVRLSDGKDAVAECVRSDESLCEQIDQALVRLFSDEAAKAAMEGDAGHFAKSKGHKLLLEAP